MMNRVYMIRKAVPWLWPTPLALLSKRIREDSGPTKLPGKFQYLPFWTGFHISTHFLMFSSSHSAHFPSFMAKHISQQSSSSKALESFVCHCSKFSSSHKALYDAFPWKGFSFTDTVCICYSVIKLARRQPWKIFREFLTVLLRHWNNMTGFLWCKLQNWHENRWVY